MRSPRYPLQPLAKVRQQKVDLATKDLGAAVTTKEASVRARRQADLRREHHAREAALVRDAEREALERGELRAGDLARQDAWALRVATEADALMASTERAQAAEVRARETEREAQAAVVSRTTEARIVETHRSRWDEARRRSEERKEEEAASEGWRPKR
jgi:hypothetical protein